MSTSSSGITSQTKEQIRELISAEFLKVWPDAQVNTTGAIGTIISAIAESYWQINQETVQGYDQLFLSMANGSNLDAIAQQSGFERILDSFASAILLFKGQEGYNIPVGTIVRDPSSGIPFVTLESVQISLGQANVLARSSIAGAAGNVPAGTITALGTMLPGVTSVSNPNPAFGGGGIETDSELRLRVQKTIPQYGSFPLIVRRLYEVQGVTSVFTIENNTNQTSGEGLPPRSIAILVDGGEAGKIGQCLFDYLPAGTLTFGDQRVDVLNPFGRLVTFFFVRPLLKIVNFSIKSETALSDAFKEEAAQLWADYLLTLAGGKTLTSDEILISMPDSFVTKYLNIFNDPLFNLSITFSISGPFTSSVTLKYNELPRLGVVTWT